MQAEAYAASTNRGTNMPYPTGTGAPSQGRSLRAIRDFLMIDTHCHLTFPDFAGRIPEVLATAQTARPMSPAAIAHFHNHPRLP